MEDCDRIFAEMITSTQGRRGKVKQLIGDQEKKVVAQAEELRLQLQEDVSKLRGRDAELGRLLHDDDHVHMIQSFQSLSTLCDSPNFSFDAAAPLRSFGEVAERVSELRCKSEAVLKDTWPRISATGNAWKCITPDSGNGPYSQPTSFHSLLCRLLTTGSTNKHGGLIELSTSPHFGRQHQLPLPPPHKGPPQGEAFARRLPRPPGPVRQLAPGAVQGGPDGAVLLGGGGARSHSVGGGGVRRREPLVSVRAGRQVVEPGVRNGGGAAVPSRQRGDEAVGASLQEDRSVSGL
uniref:TRIM8/14/16/25/29/45/65 coiled-coil region domain-containing protein n=1 Tax=Gasterosteus aculeatus aculeatus TaxID=481459 RepID=G3Q5C3_GASAC